MTGERRTDQHRIPVDPDVDLSIDPEPERGPTRLGVDVCEVAGDRARRARRVHRSLVASVAVGGTLGAVSRYALALALPTPPGGFPWSTFAINVSGSVLLGFLLILVLEQFPRGRLARTVIGTGFCGAYTTFSTYVVDAVVLVRDGHPATAAIYVVTSVVAGLAGVWAGITGARLVLRLEAWIQAEV